MFTFKQLAYFEALAREGHFGRAAQSVHVSQPALSAQIAEMERMAGRRLVERRRGGAVLTRAGHRLLPDIKAMLLLAEQIERKVRADQGGLTGTLRLGMIPTVAPYLLPQMVPALAKRYPDLALRLRETVTERLVEELDRGDLDAIIAAAPINGVAFNSLTIARDRFFIAAASNSDDVIPSPAAPDSMASERLLLLDEGHCLRDQALAACEMHQGRRMVNFSATSLTTVLQMVANGMGLTLIPEMAVEAESCAARGITLSRFASPEPSREIGLYWRASAGMENAMAALGEVVSDCVPRINVIDMATP